MRADRSTAEVERDLAAAQWRCIDTGRALCRIDNRASLAQIVKARTDWLDAQGRRDALAKELRAAQLRDVRRVS